MAPLHHHFEKLGWPETKVTMRLWLFGAFFRIYRYFLSAFIELTMLSTSAKPKRNRKVSNKRDYFNFSHFKTGDKGLFFVIAGLLIAGLIVIYSSTVVHSQNVFSDPYRFVMLQLGWILISTFRIFFFYNFNYSHVRKLSYVFMGMTFFFLFILAVSGILPCSMSTAFMPCINEANRWFILNPAPLTSITLNR
jgi:cell division protein FtsW (lipid II flippase)